MTRWLASILVFVLVACTTQDKKAAPTSTAQTQTPPSPASEGGVMSENDVPEVTKLKDIEDNVGELVYVIGTYRLMDVRKKADPPPVYKGHAQVELEDGTRVCLLPPWDPKAIRPQDERDDFVDEKVVVHGFVVPEAPPDPSGGASIIMPCMAVVTGVVSYELHDMAR